MNRRDFIRTLTVLPLMLEKPRKRSYLANSPRLVESGPADSHSFEKTVKAFCSDRRAGARIEMRLEVLP